MRLLTVKNERRMGEEFELDGKHLVSCHYQDCIIAYSGGEYQLTETEFNGCQFVFDGAAKRTAEMLINFGIVQLPNPGGSPVQPKRKPS